MLTGNYELDCGVRDFWDRPYKRHGRIFISTTYTASRASCVIYEYLITRNDLSHSREATSLLWETLS